VPPFLLGALKENEMRFPVKRDIVGVAFDIVGSHQTHKFTVNGRPFRSAVIQCFSEVVLRNGGWRESHSGDSAYAHFGLWDETGNAFEGALGAAREFRVALRSLSQVHGIPVECGIALHVSKNTVVDVHRVQLTTPRGPVIQKSFDTTSIDIDILHRMEKLVHSLPGTNIILSGEMLAQLRTPPTNLVSLGRHQFGSDTKALELHLVPSDLLKELDIETLRQKLSAGVELKRAA
jgi:class 3 adenylate cyclase